LAPVQVSVWKYKYMYIRYVWVRGDLGQTYIHYKHTCISNGGKTIHHLSNMPYRPISTILYGCQWQCLILGWSDEIGLLRCWWSNFKLIVTF
jgi:hypothetical protein